MESIDDLLAQVKAEYQGQAKERGQQLPPQMASVPPWTSVDNLVTELGAE